MGRKGEGGRNNGGRGGEAAYNEVSLTIARWRRTIELGRRHESPKQ
jgi:hypothetical protein